MTDSHLSPEVISGMATGRIDSEGRARAVSHMDSCATCRDDVAYLTAFRRRQRRRRASGIGGAAVAALALVTLFSTTDPTPVAISAVRDGDEGVPLVASYAPANGATLEGDSTLFAWEHMGPNAHYRLHVSTETGAPVLERAARDTALYVPLAAPLEAGSAYFWFVDALLEDGGTARSNVWRFRLLE